MTRAGVFGKWRARDRESLGLVGQAAAVHFTRSFWLRRTIVDEGLLDALGSFLQQT
jgi:hypothetical protein